MAGLVRPRAHKIHIHEVISGLAIGPPSVLPMGDSCPYLPEIDCFSGFTVIFYY
jgi:hypothetical protein